MVNLYINTDGGARGNPGPAAIGVVFFDKDEKKLYEHKESIGRATNNQAEYRAIIKALQLLRSSNWHKTTGQEAEILCRLDSQLVVEQINGNYKIKNEDIKGFIITIKDLLIDINRPIVFMHIPREQNKDADYLVNLALDEEK